MQAAAGLAGPCEMAIVLAGAAAAVVSIHGGGEGLQLAYSSSRSSDGSRRSVVLNNNAVSWWVGSVRIAAVEQGRPWAKCEQLERKGSEQQEEQLDFETGVEGEACVLRVRVPPLAAVIVSCVHLLRSL
jgi:hypothetical protein